MSVGRKLGMFAIAVCVCLSMTVQRGAWAQQAAPQTIPPQPADSASPQANGTPAWEEQSDAKQPGGIATDTARKFGSAPDDPGPLAKDLSSKMKPKAVAAAMRKVANWQLAQSQQYFTVFDRSSKLEGRIWTWGVLYDGLMAASESLGDPKYSDAMRDMGNTYKWELSPTESDANQQALAQAYLELYLMDRKPDELAPTQARFNAILAQSQQEEPGLNRRIAWWWCDALFMAPPAWARLYAATGDMKYIAYLDEQWAKTSKELYDTQAHLYARDASFIDKRQKNGQKVFWSRGEGWVMAGLARTLEYLPKDDPARAMYVTQLQQMSAAVAKLQGSDGLWRAGMLDPADYSQPEISGSALMTFGMAWGINNGILDRKEFTPVVTRAWDGMLKHIYADGRLGDIQQTGSAPAQFKASSSYTYGVGGFLMAGSEVYKMVGGKPERK